MEVQTFPPSPNWYLNDILCSGPNGQVIYGSRNAIVISTFDTTLIKSLRFPKVQIIEYAHKERITAVRFCPEGNSKFVKCFASTGDDSLVKLWDLNTMTPIIANFAHGEEKKVVGMDWSSADHNIITSFDDHGALVVWDIEKNTTSKINLPKLLQMKKSSGLKVNVGKLLPLVVKCCPHQKDLVAVGMKGGLVCLISIKDSGKVLHCMRGHDKDVTSLAWCPVPENVLEENDGQSKPLMLASICRDRLIYLWKALDGRFQRIIKLPTNSLGRHSRLPATGTVLILEWPSKTTILSSTNYGEILRYNLSDEGKCQNEGEDPVKHTESIHPGSQWRLVHDMHSRGVFAIHTVQYSKEEGSEEKETVVWTTAQDRHLVAVSLDDGRVLANMPTIGGFVYCMASSPFDPSRIAVGLGDFSIRIWNTGNTKEVQMSTMWQKIKGKVMAVAWHPAQEMKLAFGTHEGRVGIQDLIPGRLPVVFVLRHRHSVYALSWGPPCYKEGAEKYPQFCLYSCGDGEVLMYNPDAPEKEPKRMNILMRGGEEDTKKKENTCTDIAWKPDYSLLAIGNNDGTVEFFSPPHLKHMYTVYAHRKLLMTLNWHPLSTSSDTGLSPMRHCLATGSNEQLIQVFDLSSLIKAVTAGEEFKGSIQSIATLSGHQKKVVRLSWSPHTSGQLCSASYDNTIRVWDVVHQTCTACFTGHLGAGLACIWSPLDPDIIISGSSDFTLCAWKISEAKFIPKSINSSTQRKKAPAVSTVTVDKSEKSNEKADTPNLPLAKSAKDVESSRPLSHTWRGSLFPVSWKIAGGIGKIEGVRQLLEKEEQGNLGNLDEPSTIKLGFYGDREDMHCLLKKEESYHLGQENVEQAQLMGLWRGNVAEMLKDAIAKGKLSEWLVSIAPSASHKLWVEACQTYSEQLAKSGKYNQAAAYLLACHKVDEAIELLRNQMLYREALAIARCRLGPEDPTAHKLTLEWGHNLFLKGNYEVAAMCFTSIKEYLDAARALASRSSIPECVALGATLALKAGAEGRNLAIVLTLQCIHLHLLDDNWDAALECIKPLEELKPLSIVIRLHRKLVDGYQACSSGGKGDLLCQWLGAGEDISSEGNKLSPLLQLSSLPWSDESNLKVEEAYSCISTRRVEKVMNSGNNFMLELAEELALAVCAASSNGEIHGREWHHILKAMNLCYSRQLLVPDTEESARHLLFHLCYLLSPNGPKQINSLLGTSECETTKGYFQSARAFCAFATSMWSESKWVGGESKWPWSSLIALLLSYLPDVLDPLAASYYKEKVEIHKGEQELAKEKAKLRMRSGSQSKNAKKQVRSECGGGEGEEVSKNKNDETFNPDDASRIGNEGDGLAETKEGHVDLEGSKEGESVEDMIKEKESALATLKEKREYFEKHRISAPNPFVCLYKLRNVCDMILSTQTEEENDLSVYVHEFQDKISRTVESL